MDAIVAENLFKTYPGKEALKGLDLAIRQHTIHGFLGPNGAGKSTTMNILSCLIKQTAGKAYILGKETLEHPFFVKENLGLLPEIPPLYGEMKVRDFLEFRAALYGMSKGEALRGTDQVMEKMNLQEVKDRLIDHLSKGYKQRVGMASALIFNPPVLILDEPAAGLDPRSIREIRQLMGDLRHEHTVMFSSHHLGEVGQICDEITIIKEGKLVLSDSFAKVQKRFSQKNPLEIIVQGQAQALQEALKEFDDYEIVPHHDKMKIIVSSPKMVGQRSMICRRLVENQVDVFEMKQTSTKLEDIFIDLVESQ